MAAEKDKNEITIPVIEETLQLTKEVVDTATIRIIKKIDEENISIPLSTQLHGYEFEHVPVNEYVDEPPPPVRYEGDTMIITVVREEAVVIKRLKLVEEVRITPSRSETIIETDVTLRRERIEIEKDPLNINKNKT